MAAESENNLRLEIGHVLFIDLVGYSKLLIEEQKAQLSKLTEIVLATTQVAEASNERLVRLPTGDGMALVFRNSAEEPAQCALEITQALKAHPDIAVRMGIHSGPVSEVTDVSGRTNITGGGINMAQRAMDCGDAGHILLSKHVANDLQEHRQWSSCLHDLGECEVKHGVRLGIVNLYRDGIGNPQLPKKLRAIRQKQRRRWGAIATALAILLIAGGLYRLHQSKPLTDRDTILLADFSNSTNEPVFDLTLRQGLAVQLRQSPFLKLVSDAQIIRTLRLMGRPADATVTPEIARDLGQRVGTKAFIMGAIARLGTKYVLNLRAVNCRTGETLVEARVEAAAKEKVLDSLSRGATELRQKLGESLGTVQKFDTPLSEATTSSLEAWQAYCLGLRNLVGYGDNREALTFFHRAVEIDPDFAVAYSLLGVVYTNLGETRLAAENLKQAFVLRRRASERERLYIEATYYSAALANLTKAIPVYEQWEQSYPRDSGAPNDLGDTLWRLGQYDRALTEEREGVRRDPTAGQRYENLAFAYLYLDQFDRALAVAAEAKAKGIETGHLHCLSYQVAFLQNDAKVMAETATWAAGRPEFADMVLQYQSDTAAYFGFLQKAREFSDRAIAVAAQSEQKETAAGYAAAAALREVLMGNPIEARQRAAAALAFSKGREAQFGAAMALALVGDVADAQKLTDDLATRFPEDTQVQFKYLPTLYAQLALKLDDSAKAIKLLETAAPYELSISGQAGFAPALYPVYVRGEAYLAAKNAAAALSEFRKILDHRGVVFNQLIGALAHLGLGRAYALSGDSNKAKTAYEDFFTLWKDADPGIPLLSQAKAEYGKLL
jgi:tetratricopeptide (TPR) repeat protein